MKNITVQFAALNDNSFPINSVKTIKVEIEDKKPDGFQHALMNINSDGKELKVAFYQDRGDTYYVLFNRANGKDSAVNSMLSAADDSAITPEGERHCNEVLYPLACTVLSTPEVGNAIVEVYGGVDYHYISQLYQ